MIESSPSTLKSSDLRTGESASQTRTRLFRHDCPIEGGERTVELRLTTLVRPELPKCPYCGSEMGLIEIDDAVSLAAKMLVDDRIVDYWLPIARDAVTEFGEWRVVRALQHIPRRWSLAKSLWPRAYFRALCQSFKE